jgi:hypothetical protein
MERYPGGIFYDVKSPRCCEWWTVLAFWLLVAATAMVFFYAPTWKQ